MTKKSLEKKPISFLLDLLRELNPKIPLIDILLKDNRRNSDEVKAGEAAYIVKDIIDITKGFKETYGEQNEWKGYQYFDTLYRLQIESGFDKGQVGWLTFFRIFQMKEKELQFKDGDAVCLHFGYKDKKSFSHNFNLGMKDANEILGHRTERLGILGEMKYLYFLLSMVEIYKCPAE